MAAGVQEARDRRGAEESPFAKAQLAVRHRDKDLPAQQCSTGEQKAVLISMVLSQARVQLMQRGLAPLLLLDEVVAHLDATRRHALFDELTELDAQSWLTGTDFSLFDGFQSRAQFFQVADAAILPNQDGIDSYEH